MTGQARQQALEAADRIEIIGNQKAKEVNAGAQFTVLFIQSRIGFGHPHF